MFDLVIKPCKRTLVQVKASQVCAVFLSTQVKHDVDVYIVVKGNQQLSKVRSLPLATMRCLSAVQFHRFSAHQFLKGWKLNL